jgi:hypothetical protein
MNSLSCILKQRKKILIEQKLGNVMLSLIAGSAKKAFEGVVIC